MILPSSNGLASDAGRRCFGLRATVVGTPGDDVLRGTAGNDVIMGLAGRDHIFGGKGNDVICAGKGGSVEGEVEIVVGGPGNDLISGGPGDDLLYGQGGADEVYGGRGRDQLEGKVGDDRLYGGPGSDNLDGDRGHDLLRGGSGTDILTGGPGHDDLQGGRNGPGGDLLDFHGSGVAVTVDLVLGTATGQGEDSLFGIEDVYGSNHDDKLFGDALANVLAGGQATISSQAEVEMIASLTRSAMIM